MIGALVFNGSNKLLHINGNNEFCGSLLKTVSSQAFSDDTLRASTSSGIYSEILIPEEPDRAPKRKCTSAPDKVALLQGADLASLEQMFLPLISMYRAQMEALNDPYKEITSRTLNITFDVFDKSNVVMTIATKRSKIRKQKKLAEYVKNLAGLTYGSLMDFGHLQLSSVKVARCNFQANLQDFISEIDAETESITKNFTQRSFNNIDAKKCILAEKEVRLLRPCLQQLSDSLHTYIGENRCALVWQGSTVCATSSFSHASPAFDDPSETHRTICFSKKECKYRKGMPNIGFSQVWHKNGSGRRILTNAYQIKFSEDLSVICTTTADYAEIIDKINMITGMLDDCWNYKQYENWAADMERQLSELTEVLQEVIADSDGKATGFNPNDTTFLRNATRTTGFLQSQWNKTRRNLLYCCRVTRQVNKLQRPKATDRRLSAFSLLELVQRRKKSDSEMESIPKLQEDIMECIASTTDNFCKYLKVIIQELCLKSLHNANGYRVLEVKEGVKNYLSHNLSSRYIFSRFVPRLPLIFQPDPFLPGSYGLDIAAYCFTTQTTRLQYSFVKDVHSIQDSAVKICNSAYLTDRIFFWLLELNCRMFTAVQITGQITKQESKYGSLLSKILQKCSNSLESGVEMYLCKAIFQGNVNVNLAIYQTQKLANVMCNFTRSVYKNFQ